MLDDFINMNYKKLLKSKKFKISVWGTGHWFINNGIFFQKKINCVGYDVDSEKVRKINSGILPLADLKDWFGFNIKSLVKRLLKATSNYKDLLSKHCLVHFIAVPTEKNGKPFQTFANSIKKYG